MRGQRGQQTRQFSLPAILFKCFFLRTMHSPQLMNSKTFIHINLDWFRRSPIIPHYFPTCSNIWIFDFFVSCRMGHLSHGDFLVGADRDVQGAAIYLQSLFLSQNRQPTKVIYPHFTTATDTTNIQVVFEVLVDTILKENFGSNGLLWYRVILAVSHCNSPPQSRHWY